MVRHRRNVQNAPVVERRAGRGGGNGGAGGEGAVRREAEWWPKSSSGCGAAIDDGPVRLRRHRRGG
jgi:hypothetical protein